MNFFINCLKNKPDSIKYWQDFTIFSKQYTLSEKFSIFDEKWEEILPKLISFDKTEEQLLDTYRLAPFHKLIFQFLEKDYELGSRKIERMFQSSEVSMFQNYMAGNILRRNFDLNYVEKHKIFCISILNYLKTRFNNGKILLLDSISSEFVYFELQRYSTFAIQSRILPKSTIMDMKKHELYSEIFERESEDHSNHCYSPVFKLFDTISDKKKTKILKCLIHYDLKKFFDFSLMLDKANLEIYGTSTELTVNKNEIQQELLSVIQDFTFLPLVPLIGRYILFHQIASLMNSKPKPFTLMIKTIINTLKGYKIESMKEFESIFWICKDFQKHVEIDLIKLFEFNIFKLSDNPIEFLLKSNRRWEEYLEYISIDNLSKFADNSEELRFQEFIIDLMILCEENDEVEYKIPSIFYSFNLISRLQFSIYSKYYGLGYCKWVNEIMRLYPDFFENLCIETLCTIKEVSEFKCAINVFTRTAISRAFEKIEFFVCENIDVLVKYCKEYNEQCLHDLIFNRTYITNLKIACTQEFEEYFERDTMKPFLRFISTMPYACKMFSFSLYDVDEKYLDLFILKTKVLWIYNYDVYKFLSIFPRLHPLIDLKSNNRIDLECSICLDSCLEPLLLDCNHIFCESCVFKWLIYGSNRACPICRKNITIRLNETDCLYKFPENI